MTAVRSLRSRPDPERLAWLGVALAGVAALGFGLFGIKTRSFWLDEATSIVIARLAPADLLRTVATGEANSSLFYLLLSAWRQLGEGEIRLRLLSVLFGLATIPLLYLVGRRTVGRTAALGACALFAVQPLVIPYMQEVRGYTLAMLLSTAAILAWLHAVETDRVRWWVVFAVVASASLYAHFFCGLVIVALGVLIVSGAVPRTRRMGVAMAVVALAAIPLVAFVLLEDSGQVDWIPVLSPERVGEVMGALAGGSLALAAVLVLGVVLALARRRDEWSAGRGLLGAWLFVPIVAAIVISIWKPLLVPRYLIVVVPPLTLLAADGLLRIRPRIAAVAVLVGALALSVGPLVARADDIGEDWRGAAGWVASVARPGDRVVYQIQSGEKPFRWYLDTIPGEHPVDASLDDARAIPGRVWLVLYKVDLAEHQALLATLPDLKVDESKAFEGMRVQLLVPATP
jgi:mannosyltransferase